MKILKMAIGNREEAYIEQSFSGGLNVIYSDDNNKGKTIVVQSMIRQSICSITFLPKMRISKL